MMPLAELRYLLQNSEASDQIVDGSPPSFNAKFLRLETLGLKIQLLSVQWSTSMRKMRH